MDFPALASQCAPQVHISTLAAVVRHESGFDPLAIGINSKPHRSLRPASRQEAIDAARKLIKDGVNFDVGYGQINVRNWKWLGVTPETIFDPCVNLASAQRVLVDCYKRASSHHGPGQTALHAAFSCYNTGNLTAGFTNGYVSKVLAGAGVAVPALGQNVGVVRPHPSGAASTPPRPQNPGTFQKPRTDAFSTPFKDAFDATRQDAFTPRSNAVFGRPIATKPAHSGAP